MLNLALRLSQKMVDLQEKTRDYQDYKKNRFELPRWKADVITQIDDEPPKVTPNCFVKGWAACLFVNLAATNVTGILDIDGTSRTMLNAPATMQIKPNRADVGKGIIVGTGITAINVSDNKLTTPIANGSAAGQLRFGATHTTGIHGAADDCHYRVSSSFINTSGGSITVEEIGLVVNVSFSGGGDTGFLVDHTLSTNVIADDAKLNVTYEIKET